MKQVELKEKLRDIGLDINHVRTKVNKLFSDVTSDKQNKNNEISDDSVDTVAHLFSDLEVAEQTVEEAVEVADLA